MIRNIKEVKNMIKKITALAAALLITASSVSCSVKNNKSLKAFQSFSQLQKTSDIPKGRYIETEIETSLTVEMGTEMVKVKGRPAFSDILNSYVYTQKKDNSFDFELTPSLYPVCSSPAASKITLSPRKGYFIEYYDHYSETRDFMYIYVSPQGEYTKIDTGDIKVAHAEFSEDERLFILSEDSELFEADLSDGSLRTILKTEKPASSFDVTNRYLISYESSLSIYDYINHTIINIPEELTSLTGWIYDTCEGEDNTLYILTHLGLYRYVIGGNQTEKIIDGLSCRISDPVFVPVSVLSCSDGSFLINYLDGSVMKYSYDPDADNSYTSVLKIMPLAYEYGTYNSINEFKVKNPNIKIELINPDYQVFTDSDMSLDDYITEKLESENAPDIILFAGTDQIVTDNLVSKGLLYDLSECENLWNPDNNIITNTSERSDDGKLYNITLNYIIPFIAVNTRNDQQINSLSELADVIEDYYANELYTLDDLFYNIPFTSESAMFLTGLQLSDILKLSDGKNIDTEKLEQYFNDCKRISDIIQKHSRADYVSLITLINNGFLNDNIFSDYLTILDGYLYSVRDVSLFSRFSEKYSNISMVFGAEDDICIIPNSSASISSRSENKEAAVNFIKTILSEKVQNNNDNFGMPVNTKAFKELFTNKENEKYYVDNAELPPASDKKANELISRIENNATIFDTKTYLIIYTAGHKCITGELTPEQAAREVTEQLMVEN